MPLLHVFLQSAVYTERHVADFTFVYVFAHLAVGLHVAGELGALGAGITAQLTLIGSLSSVTASVHCQVAAVLEYLATKLTGITAAAILGTRPAIPIATMGGAGPAASTTASRSGTFPIQLTRWS